MIKVGNNFQKTGEIECPVCHKSKDTQEHLLKCPNNPYNIKEMGKNINIKYEDIFSDTPFEIIKTVVILQKALEERKEVIKENFLKEKYKIRRHI